MSQPGGDVLLLSIELNGLAHNALSPPGHVISLPYTSEPFFHARLYTSVDNLRIARGGFMELWIALDTEDTADVLCRGADGIISPHLRPGLITIPPISFRWRALVRNQLGCTLPQRDNRLWLIPGLPGGIR